MLTGVLRRAPLAIFCGPTALAGYVLSRQARGLMKKSKKERKRLKANEIEKLSRKYPGLHIAQVDEKEDRQLFSVIYKASNTDSDYDSGNMKEENRIRMSMCGRKWGV